MLNKETAACALILSDMHVSQEFKTGVMVFLENELSEFGRKSGSKELMFFSKRATGRGSSVLLCRMSLISWRCAPFFFYFWHIYANGERLFHVPFCFFINLRDNVSLELPLVNLIFPPDFLKIFLQANDSAKRVLLSIVNSIAALWEQWTLRVATLVSCHEYLCVCHWQISY